MPHRSDELSLILPIEPQDPWPNCGRFVKRSGSSVRGRGVGGILMEVRGEKGGRMGPASPRDLSDLDLHS